MNEYHKRMWNWSYAPRLFCRHPSDSVSGIVAASLLGNVFLWVPSIWLPGEQLFSEDGGFPQEDGDFSRGDQSQRTTACQQWWSGAHGSPSLPCLDLEPKRVMCTYLWWWRVRSRSRGVLRRDEAQRLQRSGGGDPGERGSGLLLSLPFWRSQEPGGSSPGLGSHCCSLALWFFLHCCHLRTKDSDWHERHFRTWASEWVYVPEAQWGACRAAPFWVDYK